MGDCRYGNQQLDGPVQEASVTVNYHENQVVTFCGKRYILKDRETTDRPDGLEYHILAPDGDDQRSDAFYMVPFEPVEVDMGPE